MQPILPYRHYFASEQHSKKGGVSPIRTELPISKNSWTLCSQGRLRQSEREYDFKELLEHSAFTSLQLGRSGSTSASLDFLIIELVNFRLRGSTAKTVTYATRFTRHEKTW
jgi:hypothetical protein